MATSHFRPCEVFFHFDDERFGQTQVRLARQMDGVGIEYVRRDNCFVGLGDFERAQELLSQQPRINWQQELNTFLP